MFFSLFSHKFFLFIGFIMAISFMGIMGCGSSGTSSSSLDPNIEGTNLSNCLSDTSVDLSSVFGGPGCDDISVLNGGTEVPATASFTYNDMLTGAIEEGFTAAQFQCMAQGAYCLGDRTCLSYTSMCQMLANCAPDSACSSNSGGINICNANKVDDCHDVSTKSQCEVSYQEYCFDAQGNWLGSCSTNNVDHRDNHNCYWGIDPNTNRTQCGTYGAGYGDNACTIQ